MDLRDAGAIVAGGASGLGAATARALAERGARVAIADLNEDAANELAEELGGLAFKADVTNEAEVEAAVAGAVEAFGGAALRGLVRRDRLGRAHRRQAAGPPASSRSRR